MDIETQMNTNSELLILLCFIGFLWYFYVAKFLPSLSSKVKSHNLWSFYTEQHLRHKHEATEMICTVTYRCERNPTVKHTYTEPHYIEHIKTKFCWNTILYLVYVFINVLLIRYIKIIPFFETTRSIQESWVQVWFAVERNSYT